MTLAGDDSLNAKDGGMAREKERAERERSMPTKRSGLKAFGKRERWKRAWYRDS